MRRGERILTDFDAIETEEEAGKDHLAQTEAGSEGGEEGDGGDGEAIDEEDGEEGVYEAQVEDRDGQCTDGER